VVIADSSSVTDDDDAGRGTDVAHGPHSVASAAKESPSSVDSDITTAAADELRRAAFHYAYGRLKNGVAAGGDSGRHWKESAGAGARLWRLTAARVADLALLRADGLTNAAVAGSDVEPVCYADRAADWNEAAESSLESESAESAESAEFRAHAAVLAAACNDYGISEELLLTWFAVLERDAAKFADGRHRHRRGV
jgi:hypothetical protein